LKKDVVHMLLRNRKVVFFFILFVAAAAFNVWFYESRVAPASGRAEELEDKLAGDRQRVVMIEDAIARYERYLEVRREVGEFKALLPLSTDYTKVLRKTYELADRRGIQESTYVVSSKDAFGDMEMITFMLPVSGDYKDVRMFIHDVETSDLFLNIGSLSLSKGGKGNEISVGISLSTYMRR